MKLRRNINLLCILFSACYTLLAINGEAEVKRQKIPVGMFNTYSMKDGNLGRAEPDLKEVWEGMPGVSDYEACNITMHYWPLPSDLPDVEPREDPYAVWWKEYMEEAYELTNQNGEVRLRVIVGSLYNYYISHTREAFNLFIEELCRWEKDTKYMGTLAGWYLAEGPMSSTHNYDPDICNEMAEAIRVVESSIGTRHDIYIAESVDGKYFSREALAAFTRPVDVVMVTTSTYIWSGKAQQPVYEPNWKTIHGPMKQVRDIVYADRRRRDLPLPQIHVVLEGWDSIGFGQPTNWEVRQQIHLALSQSLEYNDPPADGIWFFWWPNMARNKENQTDDWNYGRRLAEAIQIQTARSTFAESPWVRKESDPDETRFRFPEFGSFNPTNSCIPYDLAEPGNVRVQILDENMSIVKDFDMNYQVAGELRRFGGPYWYQGGAPGGFYIFRLYLNSKLMDEVKIKAQWNIMLNSTSHRIGVWSSINTVDVQWTPPVKEEEGLDGYAMLWDTFRDTYPDSLKNLEPEITSLRSHPLPDGDSNYFHIRSVDAKGKWSAPVHLGPFYIDTEEPGSVRDLASDSHEVGEWSVNNRVTVHWNPAEDAASGIKGYSILWDNTPGALPDKEMDIPGDATMLASEPLGDGVHYLHVRSVDNVDNWSYTAVHIGPFLIDTSAPENGTDLVSSSHAPGEWSNVDTVMVSWEAAVDLTSGIGGYSVLWDDLPDTLPDEFVNVDSRVTTAISPVPGSSVEGNYYFHIRSVDKTGNWASEARHFGPFMIDTKPPSAVGELFSPSHQPGKWWLQTDVYITWKQAEDDVSGISGYEWQVSDNIAPLPKEWKSVSHSPFTVPRLNAGVWYIHVRAVDNAGNAGESEHVAVRIDNEPPSAPVIRSSSHPNSGVWYTRIEAAFEWTAEDGMSGIQDYSWSWDTDPSGIPEEMDNGNILAASSLHLAAMSPGEWYFHLRAVDKTGNWGETSHYRVQVDPSAPPVPRIFSGTHQDGRWTDTNDVELAWSVSAPGPSGVSGYSCSLDHNPLTAPETAVVRQSDTVEYKSLPDGIWHFHCRARSGTGLWGPAAHYEIRIDTQPPEISITCPQSDVWHREPITWYSGIMDDHASGVDPGSFQYNCYGQEPESDRWIPFHSDNVEEGVLWSDYSEIPHIGETSGIYLRIRVRDRVGNLAVSDPVIIKVDLSISPTIITSFTHPDQDEWYRDNSPNFSWSLMDSYSGADGYSWVIDRYASTDPPEIIMTNAASTTDIKVLSDGIWHFHVRARDKAGNWSESAHYRVKIDSTSPTAAVNISGDVITDGNPPLVRPGRMEILLQLSEPAHSPALKYKPAGVDDPISIELVAGSADALSTEWRGVLDITEETGDGKAVFSFSARDAAGNTGEEITAGGSFVIDSISPTVTLKMLGPAVEQREKPLARPGPVEVLLQTSEAVFDPILQYLPASVDVPIPVKLTGSRDKWSGYFDVTIRTGDGEAAFEFSARDAAGNTGSEIVSGNSFEIDTLIRGDADEALDVLCVVEPKTSITIPPGALNQDVRIEIIKVPANLQAGMIAMYDFMVYDLKMKEVRNLVFEKPVRITCFLETQLHAEDSPSTGVYFWDGVRWQKIQDDCAPVEVDHPGRFALMRSEPMTTDVMYGWAAPNPFTPNGSGDATDRTIFHVAAKDRLIDFTVKIYDINGRLVKSLEAGRRAWDGTDEDGRIVESGLYIYQIRSGEQIISGTVVVLK